MKPNPAVLILLIVGCDASTPSSSRPASVPSTITDENTPTNQPSTQINSAPVFDGDVSLTLNVTEVAGKRVRLNGTTSLPSGTKLMLSVQEKMENGFMGQSSCSVSTDGAFESETFGPRGGLKDGRYVAQVTMPIAAVQPAAVKEVIGSNGEKLTGPLVENGSFGVTVSEQKEFTIGVMPDAAQAERKQKTEADIVALKRQLCIYLEQLLDFKDEPRFKTFGFGTGGPYNKWLKDVEALRDAQPKGLHPIPLLLRAAPGDLMMLGMDYLRTSESDYSRQMLPEIKDTIDFDAYLAAKSQRATPQPAFRTWHDTTGKFSVEASLVTINDDHVVLRKRDGTTVNVPLSKLSTQDVEFIEK
ncbi:MAG: SHD1 domain-containing protein [Planctomycetota bacterium]